LAAAHRRELAVSLFQNSLALIDQYVATYGVVVLFAMIYFESLGAPVPGESGLIAAAFLAARGDFPIEHMVLAVWAGAVLGDSTGYVIGRLGGRRLLHRFGPRVGLSHDRLAKFEDLFRRKGVYVVLIARFVSILRQLNGVIAGSLAMPWPRFFAANAIGAALWTAVWGLGPYLFGDYFRTLI
jgi:membrane protein DedA with SNARE-associated domain